MVDDCPDAFVLHPQLPSELFKQVAIRVRRCASKQAAGQGEIAVLNVQACVEQIVRGGQGHISLRSFQYGKILQMRVAVRKQIIEQHQTEEAFHFNFPRGDVTLDELSHFQVGVIIFEVGTALGGCFPGQ